MLKKSLKCHALPGLVLFLTSFVFLCTTFFSYHSTEAFGHDAGIFAYVGYAITQGRVLYTGAWDNKGPLLYFIQAFGVLIDHRYGIYLLEMATLFLTAFFLYKTALLFVSRWSAVVCAIFCMMSLTVTLEGGNLSEEYALPFTVGAFYLISKFFVNGFRLKKWEMSIVGICIGAIFMIRLNILAFLGCAVLGVVIVLLMKKEYQTLGTVTLFAFLGFVAILLPFVIYLLVTGSFLACMEWVYFGILGAFSPIPPVYMLDNVFDMVMTLIPSGTLHLIILFLILFIPSLFRKEENTSPLKYLCVISYFGLILTLLANSLSGAFHLHYFMSFVPVLVIPAVWFITFIEKFCKKLDLSNMAAPALSLVLALVLCINALPQLCDNIFGNLQEGFAWHLDQRYMKVSNYLMEHSGPEDTVQVIGDETAVTSYFRAKRLAASNYFYYANGRFSEDAKYEFAKEILKDIQEEMPKLIMFSSGEILQDFIWHLPDVQQWEQLLAQEYTLQENDFSYTIYKRNY